MDGVKASLACRRKSIAAARQVGASRASGQASAFSMCRSAWRKSDQKSSARLVVQPPTIENTRVLTLAVRSLAMFARLLRCDVSVPERRQSGSPSPSSSCPGSPSKFVPRYKCHPSALRACRCRAARRPWRTFRDLVLAISLSCGLLLQSYLDKKQGTDRRQHADDACTDWVNQGGMRMIDSTAL